MPRDATCKVLEERNNEEQPRKRLDRQKAAYNFLNIVNTLLASSSVGVCTSVEGCFLSVWEALAGFLRGLAACLTAVFKALANRATASRQGFPVCLRAGREPFTHKILGFRAASV